MAKIPDYKNLSDLDLVQCLRQKESVVSEAFSVIYDRHANSVYLYCLKVMNDKEKAEDCLQDVLLKFLKSAQQGNDIENILFFLLKTARNHCISTIDKANRLETVEYREINHSLFHSPMEQDELAAVISQALNLLPEDQKEAFILQYYNGMNYDEIAEVMQAPVTSVRNWLYRAKHKMKKTISPYIELDKR